MLASAKKQGSRDQKGILDRPAGACAIVGPPMAAELVATKEKWNLLGACEGTAAAVQWQAAGRRQRACPVRE